MPDEQNDQNGQDQNAGADRTGDQSQQQSNQSGNHEGYDQLGDPGKRAYDAMKAEKNEYKTKVSNLEAQLQELQAKIDGSSSDRNGEGDQHSDSASEGKTPEQIRDEIAAELTSKQDQRVLRSEIKGLAKDYLQNPGDALVFLDTSDLKPDANGEFDQAAIRTKLDALVTERPYLKAQGVRTEGNADQGPRGNGNANGQLSRDELKNMSHDQIMTAYREGRLKDITARS